MRCKNCDYPLWQIAARLCPECGTPFKPSDFEFTLNSVRFCCPHCEQEYYGTGPQGHLVPRSFACVKCSRPIDMDEMVLLPTEGVAEERTEGLRQPWLEWGTRRGFFSAFFATIGRSLARPGELMRATPIASPAMQASTFALIVFLITTVIASIPGVIMLAIVGTMMGGPGTPGSMVGMQTLIGIAWSIGWQLGFLVIVTVFGHGLLRITGGTAHTMSRTWQAVCYSSGAHILAAIPCFGGLVGFVWWIVSAIVMIKEAQKVSGGRATLAVLLPCFAGVIVMTSAYVLSMGLMAGFPGAAWTAYTPTATTSAQAASLASAIAGANPPIKHAAELLARPSSGISNTDFMNPADSSGGGHTVRMSSARIGSTTLDQFDSMTPAEATAAANAAIAAMDPNTIAYRVGDTVLTHPGIDFGIVSSYRDAKKLWVVVVVSATGPSSNTITVGFADGATSAFNTSVLAPELVTQNFLRAKYGLPPLPDPTTVTASSPTLAASPPAMTRANQGNPIDGSPPNGDTPDKPATP